MKSGIRVLIFVCVILGLLASSYVFLFRVFNSKQDRLRGEIRLKQKALADLQQSTSGIDDLNTKILKLQKAIEFFESKLPQEKEMDKILGEVSRMATACSLQTRSIKTLKSERTAQYSEQPIQMSLSGHFEGFYSFLLQIERLPRLTRLTQMNLQKIADRDGEMQASVTLSIFFEPDSGQNDVASGQ